MKVLSLLKLVRLPNIFTALSDVLAGMLIVCGGSLPFPRAILISITSVGLYSGGIALNDYFDRGYDSRHRPKRPIPLGLLSPTTVLIVGIAAILIGIVCGFLASQLIGLLACTIAAIAMLYDSIMKRWFLSAVVAMGTCRGLNWVLGLATCGRPTGWLLLPPLVIFAYIALVTGISRLEERVAICRQVVKWSLIGIPVLDGCIVLAFGYWWQGAAVASIAVVVAVTARWFEIT